MGLFSKKVKAASNAVLEIFAPVDGKIIDLTEVQDEMFAEKMMGDGVAIVPANGNFVSPMDGELVTVFKPSGHAYGIKANNGVELLIHIGLDTVALAGEGFDIKVNQGDKIKKGEALVNVDLASVTPKVPSIETPIIFMTDSVAGKKMTIVKTGEVKAGDLIVTIA
ncbi:PTS system, glucose-specific IIA component [Spiroplasma sp. TIUS-1]|uniref:PTS sugar transporter subunit IIA n=1 Tax=Spiroplasma sp. TIUS-1 TaxID=216963 RepID=UPI0013970E37|nr:PTS glucose transporter subunit IIA [Spiroplasma sp. TIUS-1]QHX35651.1 PTS system, glucose-specific IIA component [Spiroplasma sp. TIUS-1]